MPDRINDFWPRPGRGIILGGASASGKTTYCVSLINQFISEGAKFERCILLYEVHQKLYDAINMPVTAYESVDDIIALSEDQYNDSILIIDDKQLQLQGAFLSLINKLYTVIAHHRNLTIFLMLQNIYGDETKLKTILRNSAYLVIFRSQHASQMLSQIQKNFYPGLRGVLYAASAHSFKNCNYLFIDLITNSQYSLKSGVLIDQSPSFVYKILSVCLYPSLSIATCEQTFSQAAPPMASSVRPMVVLSEAEYNRLVEATADRPDLKMEHDDNEQVEEARETPKEISELLSTLPSDMHDKCLKYLQYAAEAGGLKIDPKKHSIINDGLHLAGSHMSDVLHHICTGANGGQTPIGHEEMLRKLARSRMPAHYLPSEGQRLKLERLRKHSD